MQTEQGVVIHRSEYTASGFEIDSIDLSFDLEPENTLVNAVSRVRRINSAARSLLLNGNNQTLVDLKIDGKPAAANSFRIQGKDLLLIAPPDTFTLSVRTRLDPLANSSLSGLYISNGNFFTQCEAEGFRAITYFPDRPDVMTQYSVLLRADRARFPVLLANGNLSASGDRPDPAWGVDDLPENWHWARWSDPFPKPSYLFAVVAGKLVAQEQRIKTQSGREVLLQVWVEAGNLDKTEHAMNSLVHAIRWDEQRFGLELDLDRFMIVAVSDFNMGAMENKGLNIFNTKYVFANPRISTDTDFANVESVVGHEYFHNWTGNRVTCRDWFQLTLKEGLTVFRDQEFSADLMAQSAASKAAADSARAVKRIEDVRVLRSMQFAEDAGPMAHPIRPDSYQEINNFYTLTVYEKGAEVIRMLYTLVGHDGFRKGMDLYFERHDGQAVTCDDFVNAIADANGRALEQFRRWYSQAGTPRISIRDRYDAANQRYELEFEQSCPATPGQPEKAPFQLPFTLALLDQNGRELAAERVFELTESRQKLVFEAISELPVPSLLRGFSAPVVLDYPYTDRQLGFLAGHDSDAFNRWEAGQRLAVRAILRVLAGEASDVAAIELTAAIGHSLQDTELDPSFKEQLFTLPSEGFIAEQIGLLDPAALRQARSAVRRSVACALQTPWRSLYQASVATTPLSAEYRIDSASAGHRALRNLSLAWWTWSQDPQAYLAAASQYDVANNMTDRLAALNILVNSPSSERHSRLEQFAHEYADEALVLDKWFTLQATRSRQPDEAAVIQSVRNLLAHPAYSMKNPNRFRSLVGSFCNGNLAEFHEPGGSGYQFWMEQVLAVDKLNPQVAARLARAVDRWRKFTPDRQVMMQHALDRIANSTGLSRDVREIVTKSLTA